MKDKERIMRSAQYEVYNLRVKTYPLYHCSAEVVECEHGIALRSYNTIVSWYDYDEAELVHFNHYSTTTCQQMAKFHRWLEEHSYSVDNVYRLWNTRYPWSGSHENKPDRTFTKALFSEIESEGFYRWIHHIQAGSHPVSVLEEVRFTGWNW